MNALTQARTPKLPPRTEEIEICILAGGLSLRMGSDKAKLRLGGKSFLAHIRATAKTLELPARIIRRDLVPRCGPLGGIYTALKTSRAEAILFLACDMPQVSETLLQKLLELFRANGSPVFSWINHRAAFPFLLRQDALPMIEQLILKKQFSIQILAKKSRANKFRPGRAFQSNFLNINTPSDWIELKKLFSKKN